MVDRQAPTFVRLGLCNPEMNALLKELMSEEINENLTKLREIQTSYAGSCGIIFANDKSIAKASSLSLLMVHPAHVMSSHNPNDLPVFLRMLFKKTENGEWYVSQVLLLLANLMILPDAPDMDVTICRNGGAKFEQCHVQFLQTDPQTGPETNPVASCTKMNDKDKINVRLKVAGQDFPLCDDGLEERCRLPYTNKIM